MITYSAITKNKVHVESTASSFAFPAGERHLKTTQNIGPRDVEIATALFSSESMHTDLFQLSMWANFFASSDATTRLVLPYLPGARADRGTPFGAKVYADHINSLNVDELVVFDPHSKVWVDEFRKNNTKTAIYVFNPSAFASELTGFDGVIAPDGGAFQRASQVASALNLHTYTTEKHRDFETGKITNLIIPDNLPDEGHLLVVDDICDGGGTFLWLASEVKKVHPDLKLSLYVSHGVFSGKALQNLPQHFEEIITTNSLFDNYLRLNPVRVIDILPSLESVRERLT